MIRNYLLIAWRNIRNNKLNSFINIIGLAIGLTACLSIFAFVHYELSFDKHFPDSDRIYRLALNRIYPDRSVKWAPIPPAVAPEMARQLPEIENFTRILKFDQLIGSSEEKLIKDRIIAVDSGFVNLFKVKVINGSLKNFFSGIHGAIITESVAERLYGSEDPVGKPLITDAPEQDDRIVIAVIADPLPTSHFSYSVIFALNALAPEEALQSWGSNFSFYSYFQFAPGTDITSIEEKIQTVANKHQSRIRDAYQAWLNEGHKYDYFLQRITDIHLTSDLRNELGVNSNILYVYLFGGIGIIILLIAVINFMNLATARASQRTREVGIRKTIGANRKQLIKQFLTEASLISFIALVMALPATQLVIPLIRQITGKAITMDFILDPEFLAGLCMIPFLLGLLAGSYPAFYISSFQPTSIFRKGTGFSRSPRIRKVLVVWQFIIAIFLIAGTITVFRQMDYLSKKPLGFNKNQVIVLENPMVFEGNLENLTNQLNQLEGVASVSFSSEMIGHVTGADTYRSFDKEQQWVNLNIIESDWQYLPTLDIPIIAGRNFTPYDTDHDRKNFDKVILNETAARLMGWSPNEAVGKLIIGSNEIETTVIGVTTDFNFASLKNEVGPVMITASNHPRSRSIIYIRSDAKVPTELLLSMKSLWQELVPNRFFEYQFLDESLAELYQDERLTGNLFLTFSGLAIILCCLGLLGLMAFLTERRSKEIGVRKVMGAKISQIILLLSGDFLRMVLISTLIAAPLAWYAIHHWLENFAYSVDNSIWVLIIAGLLASAISWLTVSYVAYRAARSNPVKSLRNE